MPQKGATMCGKDIQVGKLYWIRLRGSPIIVRVDSINEIEGRKGNPYSGRRTIRSRTTYSCTNLTSNRQIHVKSATKFRREATAEGVEALKHHPKQTRYCSRCGVPATAIDRATNLPFCAFHKPDGSVCDPI